MATPPWCPPCPVVGACEAQTMARGKRVARSVPAVSSQWVSWRATTYPALSQRLMRASLRAPLSAQWSRSQRTFHERKRSCLVGCVAGGRTSCSETRWQRSSQVALRGGAQPWTRLQRRAGDQKRVGATSKRRSQECSDALAVRHSPTRGPGQRGSRADKAGLGWELVKSPARCVGE